MRKLVLLAATLSLSLLVQAPVVSADEPRPAPLYQLIVHPKNGSDSASRAFLRDAFLKKTRHWPNSSPILPADLRPSSRVRSDFSKEVLGRSLGAVRAYWQQRIFSGRDVPPFEL